MIAANVAGDGNIEKGNRILSDKKNINKLSKKKLRLINANYHTNVKNIESQKLAKAANFFLKNKGKMSLSQRLIQSYKISLNYNQKQYESFLKNFNEKKSPLKAIKNKFINDMKEKFHVEDIKTLFKDKGFQKLKNEKVGKFKQLNKLGKASQILKPFGKALGPLGIATAFADNLMSGKSNQEKVIGLGVDLSVLGASSATGAAVGSIGGPFGTIAGGVIGAGIGALANIKVYKNKSLSDMAKEKINTGVNKIKKSNTAKKVKKFMKGKTAEMHKAEAKLTSSVVNKGREVKNEVTHNVQRKVNSARQKVHAAKKLGGTIRKIAS